MNIDVINNQNDEAFGPQTVVEHVRQVVASYLEKRPHLSVNGISKRCNVSEPTLRRIMSGKVKTTPQTTTILDILTYVAGSTSVREIAHKYPGPISEHLNDVVGQLDSFDREYSNKINDELKDPVKYLIYKLAINSSGVSEKKIVELYGNHGMNLLNELIDKDLIVRDENGHCRTRAGAYKSSDEDFIRNFKVVADFIKPHKYRNRMPMNPLWVNLSESINVETYQKLMRLQRNTVRKMRKMIREDEARGNIPFFFIGAMDTLDVKAAYEFEDSESE